MGELIEICSNSSLSRRRNRATIQPSIDSCKSLLSGRSSCARVSIGDTASLHVITVDDSVEAVLSCDTVVADGRLRTPMSSTSDVDGAHVTVVDDVNVLS